MYIIVDKVTNEALTRYGHFKLSRDYVNTYQLLRNAIKKYVLFQDKENLEIRKLYYDGKEEVVYPDSNQIKLY